MAAAPVAEEEVTEPTETEEEAPVAEETVEEAPSEEVAA